jgi:hypothetical protein
MSVRSLVTRAVLSMKRVSLGDIFWKTTCETNDILVTKKRKNSQNYIYFDEYICHYNLYCFLAYWNVEIFL